MTTPSDDDRRGQFWSDVTTDDDASQPVRACAVCRAIAPPAQSSHTLISAKFGWRVQRTQDANGAASIAWVCPPCWAARREHGHAPDLRVRRLVASPTGEPTVDVRSTGALDMVSAMCRSIITKLHSRATPGPKVNQLLRAVGELEVEIGTWDELPATPERRKQLWSELLERNGEADALLAAQGER